VTRRARIRRADDGFSVIELLLAIALVGAVVIASGAFFSSSFGAWMKGRELADQQQNARFVLEWTVRRLRLAGHGVAAGPGFTVTTDSIAFDADLNADGTAERYRFCLDTTTGVIREQVDAQVSSLCTSGAPLTSRGVHPLRIIRLIFSTYDGFENPNPPPTSVARVHMDLGLDSNRNGIDDTSSGADVAIAMDATVRNR